MQSSSVCIDDTLFLGFRELLHSLYPRIKMMLTSSAANFSTAVNGVLSGTLSLQKNKSNYCDWF